MTEVLSITQNGSVQEIIKRSPPIEKPVEIKLVIEEKDYIALNNATEYYKWSTYDALSMFCEFADILISIMDSDERFRSDDEIREDLE